MENIPSILQNLDFELQRIRLLYLKWAVEKLSPPPHDFADLGAGGCFQVVGSPNGRAFRVSPCGPGVCYLGRPRGTCRPPKGMWQQDSALVEDTVATRRRLREITRDLRGVLRESLDAQNHPEVWRTLQDYWWMKLGVHELAYDCALGRSADREKHPVRPRLTESIRCGTNLGDKRPQDIEAEDIRHFLSYNLRWDQYAPCSFECGPIAISMRGFVGFSDIARDIRNLRERFAPDDRVPEEKMGEAKLSIKEVLRGHYDLLFCYDDLIPAKTHKKFQQHRPEIRNTIDRIEAGLRKKQEALQKAALTK